MVHGFSDCERIVESAYRSACTTITGRPPTFHRELVAGRSGAALHQQACNAADDESLHPGSNGIKMANDSDWWLHSTGKLLGAAAQVGRSGWAQKIAQFDQLGSMDGADVRTIRCCGTAKLGSNGKV